MTSRPRTPQSPELTEASDATRSPAAVPAQRPAQDAGRITHADPVGGTRARPGAAVTAVLVTQGVTPYLPTTLGAVAAQTEPPARLVVVDLHDDAAAVEDAVQDAGLPASVTVSVLPAGPVPTFGDGVRTGLAAVTSGPGPGERSWLWLLHDDSAPEPAALAELLRAVEVAPSVAVAGCKQRSWHAPDRLIHVGVTTSRFGRRMTGVEDLEVDQGQHDGRDDVLAVGLAGALVRRDAWDQLGGPDPALGPFGDGLDLSRRARLAGYRVVVVPAAVVQHAQAGLLGLRGRGTDPRPDPRGSAGARRRAFLHLQLSGVPLLLVPVVAVLAVLSGVVRALARVAAKEPRLAVAEVTAPWAVLARPARVLRARVRAWRTRRLPRRSLRALQVSWRHVLAEHRDVRLARAEARRTAQAPSELEIAERAELGRRRRGVLTVMLLLLTAVSAAVLGRLMSAVLGGQVLTGGALRPAGVDLGTLWRSATSHWVEAGLGAPGPADPLTAVLVPLTVLTGGSARLAVAIVLLGALVLAGLGAWFAAGAATRSVGLRAWAALVWAAAPALLVATGDGRLGAVLAHLALPWVVLGVARGIGVHRVDVIVSGLVGAQRATTRAETAADDDEVLDGLVDDAGGDDAADDDALDDDAALGDALIDRPGTAGAADGPLDGTPARRPTGSVAAAAGAALAFAVLTAGAPVLLPVGILALLAVAALAPRRRLHMLLIPLPALALHGPLLAAAVRSWSDGGWRMLLADPGAPLAATAAPVWQQALGWPVPALPPSWLPGEVAAVLPWLGAALVLVALLALFRGGPVARAVRLGWLLVALGWAAAFLVAQVDVATSGADLVLGWAGPGLSVAAAGLLLAALLGADGLAGRMARHTFGWRQLLAGAVAVLAVLAPTVSLATWVSHQVAEGSSAMAVRATGDPVVPAVGRQMQTSGERQRILSLSAQPDGVVRASLLRSGGPQLTELAAPVRVRALLDGTDEADTVLVDLAARLARGVVGDAAPELSVLGVGGVLVPPVPADGAATGDDTGLVAARGELIGHLDATLGLERITEGPTGVIWRVATTPGADGTDHAPARVQLLDAEGAVVGTVASGPLAVQERLDVSAAAVVLAERADPGWRASLDGVALRSVTHGWRQAFELPPDSAGGLLEVGYEPADRRPWLVLQGAVLGLTALLALPVRRRRGSQL